MKTVVSKYGLWVPLIVVLLLLGCGLALVVSLKVRPRSDESLAHKFVEKRAEMDRLRSIIATNLAISTIQRHAESKDVLLATDKNGRTVAVSELGDAGKELRTLFNLIGCDYACQNASEFIIALPRNGIEDLYPGGVKVYAFRSNGPAVLVDSIDSFRQQHRGQYGYYQELSNSWYIKYEEAH